MQERCRFGPWVGKSPCRKAWRIQYSCLVTLDAIRPGYEFDVTCQGSVPQALEAFFESTGFEDAVRNAVSIGGDSDTVAAITGAVAEAFYGIPDDLRQRSLPYLDERLRGLLLEFEAQFPVRKTAV